MRTHTRTFALGMRIGIIGAGAAGCFCAIQLKRLVPQAHVTVYEAARRPLAKVAITGGGRCNLTNSFRQVKALAQVYPRGEKLMKKLFNAWDNTQTMEWFEQEGIRLVTQADECVFPQSQDAMDIVGTLLRAMRNERVALLTKHRVASILPEEVEKTTYLLTFADPSIAPVCLDRVVVAIGGCPSLRSMSLLEGLDVEIVPPVPSLFTFNISDAGLKALMGCVVERAAVSLAGTKFRAEGPLLITHWGVSGPAILKLSSHAARHLAESNYQGTLCVNWLGEANEEDAHAELLRLQRQHPQKLMTNEYPQHLTARLWQFLLQRSLLGEQTKWCDLAGKKLNKLASVLTSDTYPITGRCRFKEEFVTCGGVALSNLIGTTMELKKHPGIYLAGEVLDVDAVTGGFNLQAAWTMAYAVAQSIYKTAN